MIRVATPFALALGLLGLTALRAETPKCNDWSCPACSAPASSDAGLAFHFLHIDDLNLNPQADTTTALRILMFDYSAFDSAYADKVRRIVQAQLPASVISEFWEGSTQDLNGLLATHDAVVITYPSGGDPNQVKMYGKLLTQFVRQGGVVVLTGTNDFQVLQQLGLFDVEFGYTCEDPVIHEITPEHAILEGTSPQIPLSDFVYPLDVSDPDFVTLVDVLGFQNEDSPVSCWTYTEEEVDPASLRNFPVIGYKTLGAGKVVYLGMEYYHDQAEPAHILANTLRWATQPKMPSAGMTAKEVRQLNRPVKRSEEVLQAGTGPKQEIFDLKIYPNPYYDKATLDIELKKATNVAVEMTDETGRIVAVVLPQKSLSPGLYRLELPNLSAGVYFVQCKTGEKITTRKVVKTATR